LLLLLLLLLRLLALLRCRRRVLVLEQAALGGRCFSCR
jgi:hypothetical protein